MTVFMRMCLVKQRSQQVAMPQSTRRLNRKEHIRLPVESKSFSQVHCTYSQRTRASTLVQIRVINPVDTTGQLPSSSVNIKRLVGSCQTGTSLHLSVFPNCLLHLFCIYLGAGCGTACVVNKSYSQVIYKTLCQYKYFGGT